MKGSFLLFILLWLFWIMVNGVNYEDIIIGGAISFVISVVFGYFFMEEAKTSYLKGLLFFLAYVPYYVYQEIIAVSDVVYRIITGRINPGIVEVPHSHTHAWGITMLSNSITMTPGTLTLEAKPRRLFVHWLNVGKDKGMIAAKFEKFLGRIWD